jgi:hypothetical protein
VLEQFEPVVGVWDVLIPAVSPDDAVGWTAFEWMEGGGWLVHRWGSEPPEFPNGIALIGPEGDGGLVQHYFDSRGVARRYGASLEDGVLRFWRDDPDDFSQRYEGRFSDDGGRIEGAWHKAMDGSTWEHDFDIVYRRGGG